METPSKKLSPPALARRFLRWYCPPALHECIEGDLLEAFDEDVRRGRNARLWFALGVLQFFRPDIFMRNRFSLNAMNTIMIGNYFKTASRNLRKRKFYSFINAFGLSIGIAFGLLIYLFMADEKSFDRFHTNKGDIYRIEKYSYDYWMPDPSSPYDRSAWIQVIFGPVVKEELAEVKYMTRYNPDYTGVFRYGEKVFSENSITYVDGDFFRMFSFSLLRGNADRLFQNKNEVVLTPEIAAKYFGEEDPIGKTVEIDVNGEASFTVAGIIASAPPNSSLHYDILIPQENRPSYERNMKNWGNFNTPTFVQLHPQADLASFKLHLDQITEKYLSEKMEKWRKEAATPVPDDVKMIEYLFTPLPDIHLATEVGWEKVSDPKYAMILGGLAILILAIASINYIALALTTSAARRTEVGIRKTAGATRTELVFQFCFESVVLAMISMFVGGGLAALFLPLFNEFTGKEISVASIDYVRFGGVALGLAMVVGLLSGSYPSLFLSAFRPAQVLKGRFTSRLHAGFTKPLVILQFAMAAFLIVSALIMFRQMRYVTTRDLGYDQDQVLVIPTHTGWNAEADKTVRRFRERASQEPFVVSVAGTSISFAHGYSRYGYKIDGEQKAAFVYGVDPFYIPTLGIELASGRNFDPAMASDSNAVIVNEALVRDMKWMDPEDEYLNWREDSLGPGDKVIGVVKDYHFLSLERGFEPMILAVDTDYAGHLVDMLVKVSSHDLPATVEKLEAIWKELNPEKPFDYTFLDEDVARQYASYEQWMKLMALATVFAILIACLGLFGLAGINAVNRTKEIGIRKVMGAGLGNIFVLLNRQFVFLGIFAFLLASPVSWYVMRKWLDSFEFHIDIGVELFAVSMVAGLVVALVTVSYHAIRASALNPSETLKHDG